MTRAGIAAGAAIAASLHAPVTMAQQAPVNRIAVEAEHSGLSGSAPGWDSLTLRLTRKWDSNRKLVEGAVTRTRRFGQDDTQVSAALSWPVSPTVVLSATGQYSPTHRVLPKHGAGAAVQWEFSKAWLLHAGLRHSRYDTTPVDTASILLEHYFGNWSVLGGLHASHAVGERTTAAELRATWYYGDASSVGLILSGGDEATQTGPGSVVVSPVRSVALVGRHELSGPWSLSWSAHRVRQDGFYTRSGGHVGLQYDF